MSKPNEHHVERLSEIERIVQRHNKKEGAKTLISKLAKLRQNFEIDKYNLFTTEFERFEESLK